MPQSMQAQTTKCSAKQMAKCKATCKKSAASETQAVGLFTSLTDEEKESNKKATTSDPKKCDIKKCTPEQMAKCKAKATCKKGAAKATKVAMAEETPKAEPETDLR